VPALLSFGKAHEELHDFFSRRLGEPDIRGHVNEQGFCANHFTLLFEAGNKQSVGLMAHTRLLTLNKSLFERMKRLVKNDPASKGASFFPKKKGETKAIEEFASALDSAVRSCVFCEKLEHTLARYIFTIVYLWKKEPEFRKTFESSKGFCIPHLAPVVRMTDSVLSRTHRSRFLESLFTVEEANLKVLEEDILWYTQKFDMQYKDQPWKNSTYALQRTIQKLTGKVL
jgi:hypothetical protein